ncbi:MAG: ankyrin repeat domain-containing protein [Rhodocyclaceae bacterium]
MTRHLSTLLLSIVVSLFLAGPTHAVDIKRVYYNTPIARVNGVRIPQAMQDVLVKDATLSGARDSHDLRNALLAELIRRQLIWQAAQQSMLLDSDEARAAMTDAIERRNPGRAADVPEERNARVILAEQDAIAHLYRQRFLRDNPGGDFEEHYRQLHASSAASVIVCKTPGDCIRNQYSRSDLDLLKREALASFDGLVYTFDVLHLPDQRSAEACARTGECIANRRNGRTLSYQAEYGEIPLHLRPQAGDTEEDHISPAFRDPRPGSRDWLIIYMQDTKAASTAFLDTDINDDWLDAYADNALPNPQQLRNNSDLVKRSVLNTIGGRAALEIAFFRGLITRGDLDRQLSDGSTLILSALYAKDISFLLHLLAQGANPNRCGAQTCPLDLATALTDPIFAHALIDAGARADSTPPGRTTPLMLALQADNRAIAETLLLDAGADPLATLDILVGGNTRYIRATPFNIPLKNPYLYDWLSSVTTAALAKTGRYEWSASIEQGGKLHPLRNDQPIKLDSAPFTLRIKIQPGTGLRLFASGDPQHPIHMRNGTLRRLALSERHIDALAPHTRSLRLSTINTTGSDDDAPVTSVAWGTPTTPNSPDNKSQPDRNGEYAWTIDSLIPVDATSKTPVRQYKGKSIHLSLGTLPPGSGADFYKPVTVQINFR